ncbi:polyketide synthase [Hypoxylon trugodes]|uniref:polyketide synthase n=1 Tax=Hypoxylon trugodes TaxID=326681 RepID=UPI00219FA529|nr:polyketide synthase [Hypoxylon trugodes]KAI1389028.1 polyketide synthase [Hypoxylon trugodes]
MMLRTRTDDFASVTMDTACSSSMYSLHMAVAAIRNGDCDSAIVAACNCIMDPAQHIMMTSLGVLSPSSTCHTFDASADGYARGEGFVALYIKKLSDAVNGDFPIRAVIRGTAVNSNGRTAGITHPSKEGQEAVIRSAYDNAGLALRDTTFFECHGTGTPVGDPIEVSAIGNAFSSEKTLENNLLLGSVKTNLGHTEASSGIVGIMKAVLAIEKGVIPPSVGFITPNPKIDFQKARAVVVTDAIPWPAGQLRRASINSFGYGGANGHCIIDHVNILLPNYVKPGVVATRSPAGCINANGTNCYPGNMLIHYPLSAVPNVVQKADAATRRFTILPLSAHNDASLKLNIAALSGVIDRSCLADIAYTLSAKRTIFGQRAYCIVEREKVQPGLVLKSEHSQRVSGSDIPRLGFVFTGQGTQWHAMGAQLLQYEIFRRSIVYMDYILATVSDPPAWKIENIVAGDCEPERIHEPEISQTVCTAVQVGATDLLASWGVRPTVVVGHSSGEIAAAYACGRTTLTETILTAFTRGRSILASITDGAMLAVGLGFDEAMTYIRETQDGVQIAAINSPSSVTFSGDLKVIEQLAIKFNARGIFNRLLRTGGAAYHSHHMRQVGHKYETMLSEALARAANLGLVDGRQKHQAAAWISSVYPEKNIEDINNMPQYWRLNLESPVRFLEAIAKTFSSESGTTDAFIEVGPHPALKGPVTQAMKSYGLEIPYIPCLTRGEDCQMSLLRLAGTLFCLNAHIDMALVNSTDEIDPNGTLSLVHGCTSLDLPPYKYSYGPIQYYESRPSREYRRRNIARHDLVGSKIPGCTHLKPQWRNVIRLKDIQWLGDHRLASDVVFPAAGYISMAVEVASQVYSESNYTRLPQGFLLSNVIFNTMLRIPEDDYGVEVITSLDLTEGTYMSFSITSVSRDNEQWSECCSGRIRVYNRIREPSVEPAVGVDARLLDTGVWYRTFANVGLQYGPSFRGLHTVRADPVRKLAAGEVALDAAKEENVGEKASRYALHPASLDSILQLGLIACHGGQIDLVKSAYLPTRIEEMYLQSNISGSTGIASATGDLRGLRGAYANLRMRNDSGDVAMTITQLCCTRHGETSLASSLNTKFAAPVTRLTWKPDIRTMNNSQAAVIFQTPPKNANQTHLFDVFDRLCNLIVAEIFDTYVSGQVLPNTSEDINYFTSWVRQRMADQTAYMLEAKTLSKSERQNKLAEIVRETDCYAEVRIAKQVFENIGDILHGNKSGLDVVVESGLLTSLYEEGVFMTGAYTQVHRLFQSIAYVEPHLHILEIGAGTGGATRVIMEALTGPNGIKHYSHYTFTDISKGFLSAAHESLSSHQDMEFSILDIEEDPLANGFQPIYDLVVASECLHATSCIIKTLENCRKLLKPNGRLVLVENIRTVTGYGLVLGTLPGYWSGISDGRIESPFLSLEGWDMSLKAAGFSGTDIVLNDHPAPYATTCTIMSTSVPVDDINTNFHEPEAEVLFLYGKNEPEFLIPLTKEFERRQVKLKPTRFATYGSVPLCPRIIAFLDAGAPFINGDDNFIEIFQDIIRNVSTMICVTSCGIVKGFDPSAGVAAGLLRIIGTENPTAKFQFIDIDPDSDPRDPNLAESIVNQELSLQEIDADTRIEREYVWQQGCLWASRIVPDNKMRNYYEIIETPANRTEMLSYDCNEPVRADFETPGILTSLYFKPDEESWKPLPADDWVQIKVAAIGLNWKDLAVASGQLDRNFCSSEFSGIVDKVGPAVARLSPGDRVYGFAKGHFGNYVRTPEALIQRLQPDDDLAEMATIPIVYATSIYAFDHIKKLKAGDKVLIQTATGGLGLSAIQIARLKGAEIFATAGTPQKMRHLIDEVGISASHVFSLRSAEEFPKLMHACGGKGFDVILGTAIGDMLHESVKLVAPLGTYIDVGRVDVQNSMSIGLELFQKCASFSSFDLADVIDTNPKLGHDLLESTEAYRRKGLISPIRPMSTSDISTLDRTLLEFSKGIHIGKLVITFQQSDTLLKRVPAIPRIVFDTSACYLVTGGMGGLGRSILRWMTQHGARNFLVLSRSGTNTPEAQQLVCELEIIGVIVHAVQCDISIADDVSSVVMEYSRRLNIKGVVHAAVSLQDLSFDKLTGEQWRAGLAAKVQGTVNLHKSTMALALDYFIMITSLSSVVAPATQSAYTAANNFQEMFARYRRRLGLKASTVSCGLVTDVGPLSTDDVARALMARNRVLSITEYDFLRLLELAFINDHVGSTNDEIENWYGAHDDPLSGASIITCLDPRRMANARREAGYAKQDSIGDPTPRWYSDPRVIQIIRAASDAERIQEDGNFEAKTGSHEVTQLRSSFDDAIAKGPENRIDIETIVTSAIAGAVAKMLLIDIIDIDPTKTVAAYGIDSLIAAELRNWLYKSFGVNISMPDLLDTSICMKDLAGMIVVSALEA